MSEERVNPQYKDRLFCFIFGSESHKDWTLQLYNALYGTNYDDPGIMTIATLMEALYLGMHNDVAILLPDELMMWEQQSSYNPKTCRFGYCSTLGTSMKN